jgi:hypothetical protein
MKKLLIHMGLGFLFITAVTLVLLFTPLGKRPLVALLPVGDVATVDFATLRLTDKPNQFLLCPPGTCRAEAQGQSPAFNEDVNALQARWRAMVAGEPNVDVLAEEEDGQQITYVQRSARLRFPDIITVRLIALSPTRSTLAVYSRAVYGRKDFGVNRARVEDWLGNLGA